MRTRAEWHLNSHPVTHDVHELVWNLEIDRMPVWCFCVVTEGIRAVIIWCSWLSKGGTAEEPLWINFSDFNQSLFIPLVYERLNLSFIPSSSAVFIIGFILRGSVRVNSPGYPSLPLSCEIIFSSIRCCEPLTSISSQWRSEIRRLLQSRVPCYSTSSYGSVKSQGDFEGHCGLGLLPPLWSLCSSYFICWRAFDLFFHTRRLSISNDSFILNVMINSFQPKGLCEKKRIVPVSFCRFPGSWKAWFWLCPGKKKHHVAQVLSLSFCKDTHTNRQTQTHTFHWPTAIRHHPGALCSLKLH